MSGPNTNWFSSLTRGLAWLLYVAIVSAAMIIAAEFAVRALYPQINFQGTDASLFQPGRFGDSLGLKADATGVSFGITVYTDARGFRKLQPPASTTDELLLIGDSVTFGVGVETKDTFAHRIQSANPGTRVVNTGVMGYSTLNYLDVIRHLVSNNTTVGTVLLFFCLNDVYGKLVEIPAAESPRERLLAFLRSHSKLFLLIKKTLFDRSKAHALYDIGLYGQDSQGIARHLAALLDVAAHLRPFDIDFTVVLLPYEYQLRVGDLNEPQTRVKRLLRENGVNVLDLSDRFEDRPSADYFLFGDPMHLSPNGHRVVSDAVLAHLKDSQSLR